MIRFASRKPEYLPSTYLNIKADLDEAPKPPLHPGTGRPLDPKDLEAIFAKGFIAQEVSSAPEIPIPADVLEAYAQYRPTPLVRAAGLKRFLETPAEIFYKYEGVSPTGSHKSNTAIAQAYLASREGVGTLVTETGAGQWGSALAHAGALFGLDVKVFMVRASYRQKPGRKTLMKLFGASVEESPGPTTQAGNAFYAADPEHPGSLGIAIAEAVEAAVKGGASVRYALGSVLDAVLLHQTVIGQEAVRQMAELGAEPDLVVGCVGGGSNFAGLAFPFLRLRLKEGAATRFLAVEPDACPSLTRGELRYDHGDASGLTPLLYMHTLGMGFVPPPIHAGGLRYHGMAPLVSHLTARGFVEPRAVAQPDVFEAARVFLRTEGILPAPESAHAVAAVVQEAVAARAAGRPTTILFNLSGHGFHDMSAYETNGRPR
jgi:tryptophan synthase beta chain